MEDDRWVLVFYTNTFMKILGLLFLMSLDCFARLNCLYSQIRLANWEFQPLARKSESSDGMILTPIGVGFPQRPQFNEKMGEAIDAAEAILQETRSNGKKVKAKELWTILTEIGKFRLEAEKIVHPKNPNYEYGRPVSAIGESGQDYIPRDEITATNEFAHYYRRARGVIPGYARQSYSPPQKITVKVRGRERIFHMAQFSREGGGFFPSSKKGIVGLYHTTHAECRRMTDTGLEILADAINDSNITEFEFLKECGKAVFLMMEGPAFLRGTPATVMSLIEASFRDKFQKTLGRLRLGIEPFWEANFAGVEGQEGYEKFYETFPYFFTSGG